VKLVAGNVVVSIEIAKDSSSAAMAAPLTPDEFDMVMLPNPVDDPFTVPSIFAFDPFA